jgi:hypothetical protein
MNVVSSGTVVSSGREQRSKTILLRRYAAVDYSSQLVPRVVVRLASSPSMVRDQDKHEAFAHHTG